MVYYKEAKNPNWTTTVVSSINFHMINGRDISSKTETSPQTNNR